jgi:hypothetical protein
VPSPHGRLPHRPRKAQRWAPRLARLAGGTGQDPVTAIRLSQELRAAVDVWAAKQDDKPGRSEAIRRLVEIGLTKVKNKPHAIRSYSIRELLLAVRRLPATMPESDRLSKGGYDTHRDHWIGWLEEYDGPGYYGRSNWDRDARYVYQHLNNGHMIVWLNEAAGESLVTIRATIAAMLRGGQQKARMAGIARSYLPWERAAKLLFK